MAGGDRLQHVHQVGCGGQSYVFHPVFTKSLPALSCPYPICALSLYWHILSVLTSVRTGCGLFWDSLMTEDPLNGHYVMTRLGQYADVQNRPY